jgi:hypothetical protein
MNVLREQKGFVVPTAIFALVLLGVVAVAALSMSGDEQRSSRAFRESGLAVYSADAGLRHALGTWDTTAVKALNPGDSLVVGGGSGWISMPNRASYRVVIYKADSGQLQQFVVVAQGRRPSQVGGEATVTALVSGVPLFKYGIFTQGDITLSGGSVTDGYNSENGPYNPAAIDSTGSIATNGNISMSGGSTIVNGDAKSAGTNSGGTVTGTRTGGATPFPAPATIACPTGGYTPSVPGGAGISYNPATGVLTVSGGKNVTLGVPAAGYYYFSSVTLSGGATLTMSSSAHVDIYIDNVLNLSGGGIINTSSLPPSLSIWACGNPPSPAGWTLSGGSGAYFSVYAPNHDITVSGSGDIWGAIVGASLNSSGGSAIHYDEGLQQLPSKNLTSVSGSWAQVSAF